jgi:hypothetical protein
VELLLEDSNRLVLQEGPYVAKGIYAFSNAVNSYDTPLVISLCSLT